MEKTGKMGGKGNNRQVVGVHVLCDLVGDCEGPVLIYFRAEHSSTSSQISAFAHTLWSLQSRRLPQYPISILDVLLARLDLVWCIYVAAIIASWNVSQLDFANFCKTFFAA